MSSDKDRLNEAVHALIKDTFETHEERKGAGDFMHNLFDVAMKSEPHFVIPMLIGFLRVTLELSECEHCKDLIRAHLKEVN